MKKKTILRIVLAVFAAALLGGCLYLNSLLPIITGYAAKNLRLVRVTVSRFSLG